MENVNVNNSNVQFNFNNYDPDGPGGADPVDFTQMTPEEIVNTLANMALANAADGSPGMGAEAAASAVANTAGEAMVDFIKEKLEADDSIPQAKKDEIIDIMEAVEQTNGLDTPDEIANMMTALKDKYKEIMEEILAEETSESAEGTDSSGEAGSAGSSGGAGGANEAGGAGGAGGGHWMVALAKAMSEHAGNHLKKMIGIQGDIAALERNAPVDPGPDASPEARQAFSKAQGEHAARFTELTAQVQAHTQMFKMAQEMTTTVLKTLGEALNSTVRKQ